MVSDRAKRATLARLLGREALVVVMPQEHLAKAVMQDTHRENHRRTPQEVIVRARKHGWIHKGTQRARKLPRGEADPEVQPQATTGQEGFSPRRGGGGYEEKEALGTNFRRNQGRRIAAKGPEKSCSKARRARFATGGARKEPAPRGGKSHHAGSSHRRAAREGGCKKGGHEK